MEKIVDPNIQSYIDITNQYSQILEKTNQQMGLWSNPYGFLVAVLAVLFTLLAIVASIIIWRQQKEYKNLMRESLDNYKKSLEGKIEEIGKEAELEIQKVIGTYSSSLDELTGDAKDKVKQIITRLEEEKESIGSKVKLSSLIDNKIDWSAVPSLGSNSMLDDWANAKSKSNLIDISKLKNSFVQYYLNTCPKCKTPVIDNNKFCGNCGYKNE